MHPILDLAKDEIVGFEISHEELAAIRQLLDDLVLADQRGILTRAGGDNPNEFNPYYQAITSGWWKVAMAVREPITQTIPLPSPTADAKPAQCGEMDPNYMG